ncbi:rCG28857, partial [Rattus norvegicus]
MESAAGPPESPHIISKKLPRASR